MRKVSSASAELINLSMETPTPSSNSHPSREKGRHHHLFGFECCTVQWVTYLEQHNPLLRSCIVLGPLFTTGEKVIDSLIVWPGPLLF